MNKLASHILCFLCLSIISIFTCAQSINHNKGNVIQNSTFKKNPYSINFRQNLSKNIFSPSTEKRKDQYKNSYKTNCLSQPIYRHIDGKCNNISDENKTNWGSANIPLKRSIPDVYNKQNDLVGKSRPHPRVISNTIFKAEDHISSNKLSSFVFTWGQFIDHDIILTPTDSLTADILPLPNDIISSPIPFKRSASFTGTGVNSIAREQINIITAWIDASNVYGSDAELARHLRTFKEGKLKTSLANNGEEILPIINNEYTAGDERALEQPGLTSLHILFVREHNRICDALIACGITNDELIYQKARKKVGALLQAITYNEFLPALGIQLPNYEGYNPDVEPDIVNVFGTAAFRLGHTMVTDQLTLYNDVGNLLETVSLANAFFKPSFIEHRGIETILNGLAQQFQEKIDAKVVESLRSFLFGAPPNAGFDLVALNIQRGRDHGLDDYNAFRIAFGIAPARSFNDITSDIILQHKLSTTYNNDINNIDVWVGLLSEDHLANASVGQTLYAMLSAQFTALRDGDYYFYKNDPAFTLNEKINIDHTRLSDIIKRNTSIKNIKHQVFYGPCDEDYLTYGCELEYTDCSHCTSTEICNQGNCEPILDIEYCTCSAKVQLMNHGLCTLAIYNLLPNFKKYVTTLKPNASVVVYLNQQSILSAQQINTSNNKSYYFIEGCEEQTIKINMEVCDDPEEICLENSVEEQDINALYQVNVFNQITATNSILEGARAEYTAGKKILLKPGFKAKEGSYFKAKIDQVCQNYRIPNEVNNFNDQKQTLLFNKIYPNPTNDFFTISYQLTEKTTVKISLHHASGKVLFKHTKANQNKGTYELPFNVQQFSSGIYYLKINTSDLVYTKKLIIHR